MRGKDMFSSCTGRTERGGAGFSNALIISVTTIVNLAYFYSKILVIMIMAKRAEHAPKIEAPIPIALGNSNLGNLYDLALPVSG